MIFTLIHAHIHLLGLNIKWLFYMIDKHSTVFITKLQCFDSCILVSACIQSAICMHGTFLKVTVHALVQTTCLWVEESTLGNVKILLLVYGGKMHTNSLKIYSEHNFKQPWNNKRSALALVEKKYLHKQWRWDYSSGRNYQLKLLWLNSYAMMRKTIFRTTEGPFPFCSQRKGTSIIQMARGFKSGTTE